MSFLPYGSDSPSVWATATGGSVVLHGAVLLLAFSGLQDLLGFERAAPRAEPQFAITLERLDSDTIAGLLQQEGVAGAEDGEGIDPAAADTVTPAEPEQLAALAPPDPAEIEPVEGSEATVDAVPLTPETMQGTEAAALTALQPEQPQTPTLRPVAPLASEPVTLAPQSLSPVMPLASAPQVLEPVTALQAVTANTSPVQSVGPATTAPDIVASVGRLRPSPPVPAPAAAAPSAQDIAIRDLLRRIRAAPPDPCLLALPRRDGTDGVGLALMASSDGAMARFSDMVLTPEDADIRQTRVLVDSRQCPALVYVRDNIDYPATRLGIRLDAAEVPSGGRIIGSLRGTAGRYVKLLLVDNNGVVQDLQRFLSFSGNFTRFDVPVTRAGSARDTKQILLAIATTRPSSTFSERAGRLAQEVFANLSGEVADQAALAITTFDVR